MTYPFVSDGRLSRSALEQIAEEAAGALRVLPGASAYQSGTSTTGVAPEPEGFWAWITAGPYTLGGNPEPIYQFAEVMDDGTGHGWVVKPGGITSPAGSATDPTIYTAFEIRGRTDVPAFAAPMEATVGNPNPPDPGPVDPDQGEGVVEKGAVVWLRPNPAVPGSWRFEYAVQDWAWIAVPISDPQTITFADGEHLQGFAAYTFTYTRGGLVLASGQGPGVGGLVGGTAWLLQASSVVGAGALPVEPVRAQLVDKDVNGVPVYMYGTPITLFMPVSGPSQIPPPFTFIASGTGSPNTGSVKLYASAAGFSLNAAIQLQNPQGTVQLYGAFANLFDETGFHPTLDGVPITSALVLSGSDDPAYAVFGGPDPSLHFPGSGNSAAGGFAY